MFAKVGSLENSCACCKCVWRIYLICTDVCTRPRPPNWIHWIALIHCSLSGQELYGSRRKEHPWPNHALTLYLMIPFQRFTTFLSVTLSLFVGTAILRKFLQSCLLYLQDRAKSAIDTEHSQSKSLCSTGKESIAIGRSSTKVTVTEPFVHSDFILPVSFIIGSDEAKWIKVPSDSLA